MSLNSITQSNPQINLKPLSVNAGSSIISPYFAVNSDLSGTGSFEAYPKREGGNTGSSSVRYTAYDNGAGVVQAIPSIQADNSAIVGAPGASTDGLLIRINGVNYTIPLTIVPVP